MSLKLARTEALPKTRNDLLTPDEAARRLGIDKVAKNPRRVILDMCRRGQLRAVKVSTWTMVHPDSVDALIGDR